MKEQNKKDFLLGFIAGSVISAIIVTVLLCAFLIFI